MTPLDIRLGAQLGALGGPAPLPADPAPSAPLLPPPTGGIEALAPMPATAPVVTHGPLGRMDGPDVPLGDMMASMASRRRATPKKRPMKPAGVNGDGMAHLRDQRKRNQIR